VYKSWGAPRIHVDLFISAITKHSISKTSQHSSGGLCDFSKGLDKPESEGWVS
jgi:hypothetical protein